MFSSGPHVAIVDDRKNEISGLEKVLEERKISFETYDPLLTPHPENYISSVNTIFLDLYYGKEQREDFDPEICASWVNSIVSEKQQYRLVIWTQNSNKGQQVVNVLAAIKKAPTYWTAQQKSSYQSHNGEIDANKLITTLEDIFPVEEYSILGEIIDVEESRILINCLIKNDPPVFQVRRFERDFVESAMTPIAGNFVDIVIKNEPGKRTILFKSNEGDHKKTFEQKDFFEKYRDSAFLKKKPNDEGNI